MQAELEKLLILQDRDQKIRQIGIEIRTLPQQRKNLEAQLAATAASLESLKQRARQLEVERKKLELDVGTRQSSISRLKTQQYETRKNDEFQAMGHEIERYEKEIVQLEDQELVHPAREDENWTTTSRSGTVAPYRLSIRWPYMRVQAPTWALLRFIRGSDLQQRTRPGEFPGASNEDLVAPDLRRPR